MTNVVVIVIFLLSLATWPLSVTLGRLDLIKRERTALLVGIILILSALLGVYLLFRRYFKKVDPFMYVFSLFCFDAVCSLGTAVELDGYLTRFLKSNETVAEPYLKTAHGTMISYWNGTVHFLLSLAAIALYTRRDSHREVVLYWAGSLLNSIVVLFPAVITGDRAPKILTLLNAAILLLLPLIALFYYIDRRPIQARSFQKFSSIWKRPADASFLIYFKLAIVVAVFRGLAVLGGHASCFKDYLKTFEPYLNDPSKFPMFQTLTYEYLFLIYYLIAAYGLLSPGQHWMSDWSLVYAGAAAQAQFSYISGSLHHRTSKSYRSPMTGTATIVFWALNLTLFVVPHLFAFYCQRNPEKFGRTYTVELATPVQTYTANTPRRPVRLQKRD